MEELAIAEQKFQLGAASEADVSKMRVQVAQKKLNELQAANAEQRAKEQLCVILNFPLDTLIDVDTLLHMPATDNIPPIGDFLKTERNRNVAQARLNLRSAQMEKLSSWLSYMPRLSFSSNWSWSGGEMTNLPTIKDEGSFSYGLSLSWTLFSGTSRVAEIRSSNAGLRQSAISYDKTSRNAEQQIREAYRTMTEATASFQLSVAQIDDAEMALKIVKARYELGSATVVELLDAELVYEQAQLQKVGAVADYYRTKAQLEWLVPE